MSGPSPAASAIEPPTIPNAPPRRSAGTSSRIRPAPFGKTTAPETACRTRNPIRKASDGASAAPSDATPKIASPPSTNRAAAVTVAELAGDGLDDGEREEVGGDEPPDGADRRVEVVDDVRQRDGDHRRVERRQQGAQCDGDQHRALGARTSVGHSAGVFHTGCRVVNDGRSTHPMRIEYGYGVTDVVERYLTLGLALGRHVDGLVDSYYGPAELAEAVNAAPPVDPAELAAEAEALAADVSSAVGARRPAPGLAVGSDPRPRHLCPRARRREPVVRRRGGAVLRRQAQARLRGGVQRGARGARRAPSRRRIAP